jgi:N-formylglutamate deformylase
VELLRIGFEKRGFVVAINQPFAGAFVPSCFHRENRQLLSVMIEVNRSLYMDEATGRRHSGFERFQLDLAQVLSEAVMAVQSLGSADRVHNPL